MNFQNFLVLDPQPPFYCFHAIGRSLKCRESGHDKCIETGQNLIENGLKCSNFKYSFKNLDNRNVESGHHLHKNAGVYILQDIVRVERQQGKYETEQVGKNNSKKREKIVKKWSKNAPREVLKSKIFLPRGRGHPFPWTPSPAASALRASARILGPSGLAYSGCSHLPSKISGSQPLFDFKKP